MKVYRKLMKQKVNETMFSNTCKIKWPAVVVAISLKTGGAHSSIYNTKVILTNTLTMQKYISNTNIYPCENSKSAQIGVRSKTGAPVNRSIFIWHSVLWYFLAIPVLSLSFRLYWKIY